MKDDQTPQVAITSSRGQVVIPRSVRKRMSIKKGSAFAVSVMDDLIIMKKLNVKLSAEDIEILNSVSKAWQNIEAGRCRKMNVDEFFKELEKW